MTENIEERTYEEMAKYMILIFGDPILKKAKKLGYMVTSKDIEAWWLWFGTNPSAQKLSIKPQPMTSIQKKA